MPEPLGGSLALVAPDLPPALVDPTARQVLARWAGSQAPIPWAGLECPLSPERWVDFHQGVTASDAPVLMRHLARRGGDPIADRLGSFCAEWTRPGSTWSRLVPNLVLEHDVRGAAAPRAVPSVFVALRDDPPGAPTASECEEVIGGALTCLAAEPPAPLWSRLSRCIRACPDEAAVSHLGVILARQTDAVRLNVRRIGHDAMGSYLDAIEWSGSKRELEAVLPFAFANADRVTLSIDVGPDGVGHALGLECVVDPPNERWQPFLARLVEEGLCTPQKSDSLSAWPGRSDPARSPWPDSLILASLRRGADEFGVVERYLSHVKLSLRPGNPLEAKGYLGFVHRWIGPEAPSSAAPPRPSPVRSPNRGRTVDDAISEATEFLLRERTRGGFWQDYPLSGTSDEWVTAYVAAVMVELPESHARAAAGWGLRLLLERLGGRDGWGWTARSGADADTTAWALRLAAVLGAPPDERLRRARAFLEEHLRADGAVATYLEPNAVLSAGLPARAVPVSGWCAPHVCVTAVVAGVPRIDPLTRAFLRGAQLPDGHWQGYWWCDDEYATAFAAEALAASGVDDDRTRVAHAARWALERVAADGSARSAASSEPSPFCTALCLRILSAAGDSAEAREPIARWLVEHQANEGGWSASAYLRVPPPDVVDPRVTPGSILLDWNAQLTTATVLAALARFRATAG
jgi:squalene-hopene cyclase-like protein